MAGDTEKLADKVARLSRELGIAQDQMARCNHQYSPPIRASRTVPVPVFSHYEPHGSDPEPIYNWVDRKEYGWERVCEKCGYKQYTTKSKPVIKNYEPDFTR